VGDGAADVSLGATTWTDLAVAEGGRVRGAAEGTWCGRAEAWELGDVVEAA
jgi:hypothetical protein